MPSPCEAKRANESTSPGRPARINSAPTTRVACRSKNGGRNSQCVIHHGMSPAKTLGATTKKRAEPRMADSAEDSRNASTPKSIMRYRALIVSFA